MCATISSHSLHAAGVFVLPRHCPICETTIDDPIRHWCLACESRLKVFESPVCPVCRRFRSDDDCECPAGHEPSLPSTVIALGCFDDGWGRLVHAIKYDGYRHLTAPLGALLAQRVDPDAFDLVVAVPTSAKKRRNRGFGHAEELAQAAAAELNLPILAEALTFTRPVKDQTRLSALQRRANLDEAMVVAETAAIAQKRVLLIDDVMTTGATISEAARALVAAGAQRVSGAVIAVNLDAQLP
jgi:ComF family protein